MRRYRWAYLLGSLCILGSVLLRVLIPYFLGDSLDELRSLADEPTPEEAGRGSDVTALVLSGALSIVVSATLAAVIRTASRVWILGSSRRVIHDLREQLFDHLLKLAPSYYIHNQTGHLMSRLVNDTRNVQGLMGPVFMWLAEVGTLYVCCLSFMFQVSPKLTLAGLAPFPFFLFMARKQAAKIQQGSRAAQEGLARVSARVEESLSGQLIIKSLALEEFDQDRFARDAAEYRRLNLEVTRARAVLGPLMMGLGSLSTLIVVGVGGPMVVRKELELGELLTMVFWIQMLAYPTGVVGFILSSLQRGAAALARVKEILDTEVALADPPEPIEPALPQGALQVRQLSLRFPVEHDSQERTVLEDLSFELPAGSTLGIVGPTGAGKSVLMRVLARQLEIDPGHVYYDGVDVTRLRVSELRRRIGYVPQETFLFSESLAENIAIGKAEAGSHEIHAAVEASRLDQDLRQLPEGLDTLVGERGHNLSGGQRQRTAIARVMLLDPRLLLLDDCLSAVDTHTADEILQRLRPLMAGRSTVIVAHRIATIQHADQILVMDDGRIVERGNHEQLVQAEGLYARLHRQQMLQESLQQGLQSHDHDGDRGA